MARADPNKGRRDLGLAVTLGFLAGILLQLLTVVLSNSDIGGANWSLRGNGALVVLFAGAPTVLAFGWLLVARRTLASAAVGALIVLLIELVFVAAPILAAPTGIGLPLVIGCLAAALLGGVLLTGGGGATAGAVVAAVAMLISLAPLGLTFFLVPLFLPLIVALPSIWVSRGGWVVANAVALAVALILGIVLAQMLAGR